MPPQLMALTEGPNILLDKPILLLGRHQECDIQLVSRKVSRRHCCIAQVEDHLVIRDLGSTNGVRINGVRVLEGKLKAGDELTIGNYRYRVHWDARPGMSPDHGPAAAPLPGKLAGYQGTLESCEMPVALPEPFGKRTQLEGGPPSEEAFGHPADDVDQPVPTEPAPRSLILPEKIDLAPINKDALPPVRKRPLPPQ